MPDNDYDAQLRKWLSSGPAGTVTGPPPLRESPSAVTNQPPAAEAPIRIGPRPEIAIDQPDYQTNRSNQALLEMRFIDQNTELDESGNPILLDTFSGLPTQIRLRLSQLRDEGDKVAYLKSVFPKVRLATDKTPIVRVFDEATGTEKDVLADERRMTFRDFADLASAAPELIGSLAGLRAGRVAGLTGKAKTALDIASTALGAQTFGAAADVLARQASDLPIRPTEIGETRLKMAGVDTALDVGTLGAGKVVKRGLDFARAPFGAHQTQVQRGALDAVKNIEAKTGIAIPLTPAEQTGSPSLSKLEAFSKQVSGGRGPLIALEQQKEERLRDVQEFMLGTKTSPLPSGEAVGKEAIQFLQDKARTLERTGQRLTADTVDAANREVENILDAASLPERALLKRDIGTATRHKATAMREEFRKKSHDLYEEVWKLPGGRDRIFSSGPLVANAQKILDSLPQTAPGTVSKEFVPSDVVGRLREITANPTARRSLLDLRQMRTDVSNAIAQGEAIPGVQTHYLSSVEKMLTKEMERVTSSIPDGKLKAAWEAANNHYKTEVGKFHKIGIAELFRQGDVPGSVGDAQLVGRILGNSEQANDRYFTLKEFLGDKSREWKMLKRALVDDIYEASLDSVAGRTLDAGAFLKKVDGLDREIRKDLFGPAERSLRSSLNVLGVAEGKINIADVEKLIDRKTPSFGLLQTAMAAEAKKDKEYKKSIMKLVTTGGELNEATVKPAEFVDRFMGLASKSEVEDALSMMASDPALVEKIRRKAIEKVFLDARRSPSAIDIAKGLDQDPTQMVSGKSIFDAIGKTPDQRNKLRALLGDEQFNLLVDYARVTAAGAERDRIGGLAGSLTQGGIINSLIQKGLKATTLEALAKYRIVAYAISNPAMRRLTAQTYSASDWPNLATSVIVSTPFLEELASDSSSSGPLYSVLNSLKKAAGLTADDSAPSQPASDESLQQWLQQPQP